MTKHLDRFFLLLILLISVGGFILFASASLGLLSREGASFGRVAAKQLIILLSGLVACVVVSKINYKKWRRWALPLFVVSLLLTFLVFVPGVGLATGGARRWVSLGSLSFQPAELLKFSLVVYLAAWFASNRQRMTTFSWGVLPFVVVISLAALPLIFQPDIGTLVVVLVAAGAMFLVAGPRWSHLFLLAGIALLAILAIAYFKPYARERLSTFLHPTTDRLGSAYQINQSWIAIGSGGIFGRGFGQSIQKFNYLPEPIGDSIFAVASEEFGFLGSSLLVLLFLLLALWGLKIASRTNDSFGRLLVVGVVIMITAQAFINMAALLGLVPLTGIPLVFISHGGTALFITLVEAGIILNVSRYQQTKK